jgi:FHA domain/B-box zinc finger
MRRLVVNPGTPQAWEIQLKPGSNLLGRGFANDFRLEDPSVSSSHCEITVSGDSVSIKDLGSTNGTFVDRQPVQEAKLNSGQTIHLGGVPVAFYSDESTAAPATAAVPVMATASGATASPPIRPSIRIASAAASNQPAAPPMPPPVVQQEDVGATAFLQAGPRFCKFHPKSPARYLCTKCNRTFCELCVVSRTVGGTVRKNCRSCGVECQPLQVTITRAVQRGFYASLPGAFIYPFRGMGLIILILATCAFAALGFLSAGLLSIFAKIVFYGFLFLFMQNIIHTTVSDENEPLSFPDTGGLFGAAFQLAGTILVSFGLAIGLLVARLFDVEIPVAGIIAAVILGCLYFPMAFLAVAMKDSVMAANPLVVIPSIMKIPVQYLVASIVLMSVFGARQLGGIVSSLLGMESMSTHSMNVFFIAIGMQAVWAFVSVYLLTVNMRILGLLYTSSKDELGWFSH